MDMEEAGDLGLELIGRAFQHAAVAGGLRVLVRNEPNLAPGLLRVADAHGRRCTDFLGDAIKLGVNSARR
jgi:hypothetical protein